MSAAPSCVHTTELKSDFGEGRVFQYDNLTFAFNEQERWDKEQLTARLEIEGDYETAAILNRCGEDMRFICTCCGSLKTCQAHCKKRYCPLCARSMAAERVERAMLAVSQMEWPLTACFTRKNLDTITGDDFADQTKAMAKLREQNFWRVPTMKRRSGNPLGCYGGFASHELTNIGNGWHLHTHALLDAQWLSITTRPPHRLMSQREKERIYREASTEVGRAWAKLVGQDEANILLRRPYGAAGKMHAAIESIKYTLKAADLIKCEGRAADVIAALKGRRLFGPFGNCWGRSTKPHRSPLPCDHCEALNSYVPEFVADAMARGPSVRIRADDISDEERAARFLAWERRQADSRAVGLELFPPSLVN